MLQKWDEIEYLQNYAYYQCFQALPGEMGDIEVGPDGRAEFRFVNHNVKVWDMIGRSMIIHNAATEMVKQGNASNSR